MNQQPLMGGTNAPAKNAQPLVAPKKKTNRPITAFNPNETVSGNLDRILDTDNALMQRTRSTASKTSAERGLLNSSAAVAAGEQAVIAQATDIAKGDALAFQNQGNRKHDINKLNITFDNDSKLMDKDQTFKSGESALNRTHDQTMQSNDQTFKSGESALNRTHDQTMIDKQSTNRLSEMAQQNTYNESITQLNGSIQSARDNMLHGLNLEAMDSQSKLNLDSALTQLDQQHQNNLGNISAQASENAKLQYTNSQGNLIMTGIEQLGAIYSNTEMTPEQQAAAVRLIQQQTQNQSETLALIYNPDYVPANSGTTTPSIDEYIPPDFNKSEYGEATKPREGIDPTTGYPYGYDLTQERG